MSLFDFWPDVDLSKLNLDWIILKIKNVEKADAQAQEVLDAAAQILPVVDQIHEDAQTASTAASDVQAAMHSVQVSEQNAALSAQAALGYNIQAGEAKDAAAASAEEASRSAGTASSASNNANNYNNAAYENAQRAEQYALRAETAGSTAGIHAYEGMIAVNETITLGVPDGTYLLTWFCNDAANSSAQVLINLNSGMMQRRSITYNGSGSTGLLFNVITGGMSIRSQLTGDVYYMLTGCES